MQLSSLNLNQITKDEINCAIKKLQNGKAGGVDMIIPELLKSDIEVSINIINVLTRIESVLKIDFIVFDNSAAAFF